MNTQQLWQTFLETGAPEIYLLYNQARKLEDAYVSDGTGAGAARNGLQ